jgi:hypothetical protein
VKAELTRTMARSGATKVGWAAMERNVAMGAK